MADTDSDLKVLGAVVVDLLLESIPGNLHFASVFSRAERVRIGAGSVRVACPEDIIRSKAATGRPKDKYHLEVLRQVLAVRASLADDEETNAK